jgi:uncharacterized membrane protein (UPF0127 family)
MKRVRVAADSWVSEASRPSTFLERLRGMRGQPDDASLLFETSSVHTIGMVRSIAVVMIGRDQRVVRTQTVPPNRVVRERGARYILELPAGTELPANGAEVEILDV